MKPPRIQKIVFQMTGVFRCSPNEMDIWLKFADQIHYSKGYFKETLPPHVE